jgi:glycosyltransferase involved in cell wall biosynthesis
MHDTTRAPLRYINRDLPSDAEVSFFVPCLNEQGNVGRTLATIATACRSFALRYEVLVVDDASTDGTRDEVIDYAASHPDELIRLIANECPRGLARNYVDAAYIARGTHYMLVNGDHAEPAETLVAVLALRGQADIVIPVFGDHDRRTPFRRFLSRTFTRLVNVVSGTPIQYYNGVVLHRRFNVMRWHADTDGFAYQSEIITRLIQEGATFKEVLVSNSDRDVGASKALTLKNLLAVSHSLVQIGFRRLRFALFCRHNRNRLNDATIIDLSTAITTNPD